MHATTVEATNADIHSLGCTKVCHFLLLVVVLVYLLLHHVRPPDEGLLAPRPRSAAAATAARESQTSVETWLRDRALNISTEMSGGSLI